MASTRREILELETCDKFVDDNGGRCLFRADFSIATSVRQQISLSTSHISGNRWKSESACTIAVLAVCSLTLVVSTRRDSRARTSQDARRLTRTIQSKLVRAVVCTALPPRYSVYRHNSRAVVQDPQSRDPKTRIYEYTYEFFCDHICAHIL